jgi:hypothetical protein
MTSAVEGHALGRVAPGALGPARLQLHWLFQGVGAAGDAFLARASDDGQGNAEWLPALGVLAGRPVGNGARLALHVADLALHVIGRDGRVAHRFPADGRSLDDRLRWAGDALGSTAGVVPGHDLHPRDYDMPEHPVSHGASFTYDDPAPYHELARWFGTADGHLRALASTDARATEVRCWPHHFDVGGIIFLDRSAEAERAPQIGFGLSPGDGHVAEPYYYVTPWPIADGASFPELPGGGRWYRESFTGAVLTGSAIVEASGAEAQAARVRGFLEAAVAASHGLIGA